MVPTNISHILHQSSDKGQSNIFITKGLKSHFNELSKQLNQNVRLFDYLLILNSNQMKYH